MKSLKIGYIFAMVALFVLTVILGIAAFYPAPKRYDYPQYPTRISSDFNSPEYQQQQRQYEEDLKNYQEKNKDVENQRKIWGQNTLIISLIAGAVMLLVGALLFSYSYFLSVSLLFGSFIMLVSGPGLASYYSDSTTISLFGTSPQIDLTRYKQIQFFIALTGSVIGAGLSFMLQKKEHSI